MTTTAADNPTFPSGSSGSGAGVRGASPLRVAVVGLGAIGREHLAVLRGNPLAEVVAVVDPIATVRDDVAAELGIVAHADLESLLTAGGVDAVVLATPDHLHVADASRLMKAGIDVLVEKPIATERQEIIDLVHLAEDTGVVAMPGQTLRFEPRYHWAHGVYQSGSMGTVQHGYLRRNNKISVAARTKGRTSVDFFLGVHDIDALLWITGDQVVEVSAAQSDHLDPSGHQSVAVLSTLRLASGAVIQCESAWNLPENYPTDLDGEFRLVCAEGVLSIPSFDAGVHSLGSSFELPMTAGAPLYGTPQGALAVEDDQFVRACLARTTPPVTMREAGQAALVVHAIREAVQERRTVDVPALP